MSQNTKNYKSNNGDTWTVGGTLDITTDGKITKGGEDLATFTEQEKADLFSRLEVLENREEEGE